jgi:hypothetical protein
MFIDRKKGGVIFILIEGLKRISHNQKFFGIAKNLIGTYD